MLKKILLILFAIVAFQTNCLAQEVSFIYINGSNNNDEKMRTWFVNGVQKIHPLMKRQFEKNRQMKKLFLRHGQYSINPKPTIFYWGDKSRNDLAFVRNQLDISKALSPTIAYEVREVLASFLHDAIWVQKKHNMMPILDELNDSVQAEVAKGNRIVLYGYSAGSFITYEYLFNKLPYLNLEKLFSNVNVSDEFKGFVKNNPINNTCISALKKGGIGVVTSEGHLLFDSSEDKLKSNYIKLNDVTKTACAPSNGLKGIVNFASPLVLFYSDLADSEYELTYYNKLMMKYIVENDLFWITVNYREDPLGFPTSKNLTNSEMAKLSEISIENPTGFIYDYSSVWSKRSFLFAHTAYWSSGKTLPKAVVKAYSNGYRYQYDPKFQKKVLKNDKAKIKYEAY